MGAFSVDLERMYRLKLGARRASPLARTVFWLFNSEFHCVASYRFGRFAEGLRSRNRILGEIALTGYRVLNRWVTHIDHADISRFADIGPGLLVMHRYGLVVGPATIGSNLVLHQNVTIGQRSAGGSDGVPRIGNNVWIGPGAVLSGGIEIGDGVTISAGTVLSKGVPARCLVAGNPGRVIRQDYDNSAMLDLPSASGD